jgi:hypothetical protein
MPSLEALQRSIADTLAHGPTHFDPGLYSLAPDRALLGLRAHANTVSHARLVALEDCYPLTRAALGEGDFNALSRDFLDMPGVTRERLAAIGLALPAFLASRGVPYSLVDLARAEWAWLLSYHGPEALPFDIGALAGRDEAAVLATRLRSHPASHIVSLSEPAGPAFAALGDVAGAHILLFTRPEADVLVTAIEPSARALLARLKAMTSRQSVPVGELFARLLAEAPADDPAGAFLALATTGAFARSEDMSS